MNVDIKRPVYVSGENPGMTLYKPNTDQPVAILSYWHVTDSPHGTGSALILWLAEGSDSRAQGGIFTDNLSLARILTESLTQYFPEFESAPIISLPYHKAQCAHVFDHDAGRYTVTCVLEGDTVTAEWGEPVDRMALFIPDFPIGSRMFELHNVLRPCKTGVLAIKGKVIDGQVKTATRADGSTASTAFLAFAESWVGPLDEVE